MPRVPTNTNMGATGQSPLTQVKPENLLMAASEMQRTGRLADEEFSTPSATETMPDPSKVRPRGRKLRVVR